jgi:UTP-glucose-1-phosphate uridylyltransferase
MKLTLVIMAAGIGSRYGGVKQLDGIGPNGETIMDYSIYDALNAGFTKVVFIIRKELQEAFDHQYEVRFKNKIEIEYVYQDEFKKYEEDYTIERTKPWGTGHAMLSANKLVKTPFAIINADDYYGKSAFSSMADALSGNTDQNKVFLLGFRMINTLSDHGTVSRGLCRVNEDNYRIDVRELTKIAKKNGGIFYE